MGKPYSAHGPCDGALKVGNADALSGWGPLLYDVAIEYATQIANGLIPDRDAVSQYAQAVWRYYLVNRVPAEEVQAHQLDDLKNTLTYPPDDPEQRAPIEWDNCNQNVAKYPDGWNSDSASYWKDAWPSSPLSKRYTKAPTTIKSLRDAKKLVIS